MGFVSVQAPFRSFCTVLSWIIILYFYPIVPDCRHRLCSGDRKSSTSGIPLHSSAARQRRDSSPPSSCCERGGFHSSATPNYVRSILILLNSPTSTLLSCDGEVSFHTSRTYSFRWSSCNWAVQRVAVTSPAMEATSQRPASPMDSTLEDVPPVPEGCVLVHWRWEESS